MSVERIIAGILVFDEKFHGGMLAAEPNAIEKLTEAITNQHPDIMPMVDMVQKVVSAYMGATKLDMHVTAMELITLVSQGGRGKGKDFEMFVPEGPGTGDWLARVIPTRVSRSSAVILPRKPKIVLPSPPIRG